jgi:GTP-binding protein HflX
VLLADTVGFVRKLPHLLIEAFKSTLEETRLADYILEILDASDEALAEHHETTLEVLHEIGAGSKPALMVLNKWDLCTPERREELRFHYPEALPVSVLTGDGLPALLDRMTAQVKALMPVRHYLFPHHAYADLAQLRKFCFVEHEEFLDDGVHIAARIPLAHLHQWDQFLAAAQPPRP